MGYGGVSGRPSFPNMDRSVFRACLGRFLEVPPPKDFCCRLVGIVSGDGSAIENLRARRYRHLKYVLPLAIYFGDVLPTCAPLHSTRLWGSQRDWSPWSFIWMALPRYC